MSCPEPGIYTDIPFDVYASWDAVSNSGISLFERSPAHYRENYRKETQALRLGSAIHECVTNLRRFQELYLRGPENPKKDEGSKKTLKYWKDAQRDVPDGKTLLTPEEYDMAVFMREKLHRHKIAGGLLKTAEQVECSLVWDDPQTGIRCKGRADILNERFKVITDLKTTQDAREYSFSKSIYDYNYHRQAAFYLRGMLALGRPEFQGFVIIAVEKDPPFECVVHKLSKSTIDCGEKRIREVMPSILACQAANNWPGYAESLNEINLPHWANREQ